MLHLQESVQHKLTFLHLHLLLPQFSLQPHSVSAKGAAGAGGFVIIRGMSSSSSFSVHPFSFGEGRFKMGLSALYQMYDWWLACIMCCFREFSVGGSLSLEVWLFVNIIETYDISKHRSSMDVLLL